jgi:hypothetical protein
MPFFQNHKMPPQAHRSNFPGKNKPNESVFATIDRIDVGDNGQLFYFAYLRT